MAEPATGGDEKRTLVRGADGALYLLSKNDAPMKLDEDEAAKLKEIVQTAEDELSEKIRTQMPALGGCVHLVLPEVFQ